MSLGLNDFDNGKSAPKGATPETPAQKDEEKKFLLPEAKPDEKGPENASRIRVSGINAVIRGSKVIGSVVISQDLEITGDVEGDITSEENSNIFVRGTCKGNIRTKGGSVEIEGEMSGGDIIAGGHVKVTGKFSGGKIQAKEKIYVNGEFSGVLESNEIEVGSNARGKVELIYKEDLSIQKGAKIEGRIVRLEGERKPQAEEKKEKAKEKKSFFSKKGK